MLTGCLVCICSAFALAQHESVAPSEPPASPRILARRTGPSEPVRDEITGPLERSARTQEGRSTAVRQLADLAEDDSVALDIRMNAVRALGRVGAVEVQDRVVELAKRSRFRVRDQFATPEEYAASYDTREVADMAKNTYWEIELSKRVSKYAKLELLGNLSRGRIEFLEEHHLIGTDRNWVVEQLAAYEDPELLPVVAEALRIRLAHNYLPARDPGNQQTVSRYMMVRVRVLGLAAHMKAHGDRFEALKAFMHDPYGHEPEDDPRRHLGPNHFTVWAVKQIFELGTEESIQFLVDYARELQDKYHDEDGFTIVPTLPGDEAAFFAYRRLIALLRDREGWTRDDFAKHGLYPDRYFRMI